MAASRSDPSRIRTRKIGKVETVFNSQGRAPNGLQATREGLWIIDQGAGNRACLVRYPKQFDYDFDRTTACKLLKGLVGAEGFEPSTSWSRTRRSTRLSHAPNLLV